MEDVYRPLPHIPDHGPAGPPITIIMNRGSGADEKQPVRARMLAALLPLAPQAKVVEVGPHQDLQQVAQDIVRAAKQHGGVVAAAGGDGTVNTVAHLCCQHQVPLGVIALGTFNYFARELAIPADPAQAAALLATGVRRQVSVGYVNQRLFLNNASFGLYTHIIRRREQHKSRFGRFRLVAIVSALWTLLRGQKPFAVKIDTGADAQVRRTSMVFVGNNTLQLNHLDLELAQCARQDKLAVVLLKPLSRRALAPLLWRGLLNNLGRDTRVEMFCAEKFEIASKRRHIDVVLDGEVVRLAAPLSFRAVPRALTVIVPAAEAAA